MSNIKLSKIKKQEANDRWRSARSQSTMRKKMAIDILATNLQCLYGNLLANNFL